MQTRQRPSPSSSDAEITASAEQGSIQAGMVENRRQIRPATLPAHSRAAAAQRLNELPDKTIRGVYYPVPHLRRYPAGWRTKRHIKRKNLRYSELRYLITDRHSQWAIMPLALGALAVIVVLASALIGLTAAYSATQQHFGQQVVTLQDILPQDSLKMYDEHGTLIYQMTNNGLQTSVPLSKISPYMVDAEVATEDQYFWSDPGYDITGVVRAALQDLMSGHILSGGSTITQQLIKQNIVGNRDTVIRKLQEILLAPEVTRRYTKQQIMDMYLNTTFYGENSYGVEAAAFTYFDLKDTPTQTAAQQLDIAQAAMLAGIPSAPVGRDPFLHWQASVQRVQEVLKDMYIQGYITYQQRQEAIAEVQRPDFLHRGIIHNNPLAIHFVNYALNELARDLHVKIEDLARAGLIVSTTLDLPLQQQVLQIARQQIAANAAIHHMSDAAEVMINFHNGDIRVLLGNIDPTNPQYGDFDVASEGYRQPGSAFKPFVYATAFEQGVSPGMPVLDGPLTIQMCCGLPSYTPTNYDMRYHGLITYRYALANSFNIPAVKLLMQTGVQPSLNTALKMGITSYVGVPNYTMVLGSLGVHLLDMTSAYGVFANGGVRIPPHAIDTVTNTQGRVIYHFQAQGQRIISKQVAYMMTNVLSDNNARTYEFGKCSVLLLFSNTQQQCYAGNPGMIRPSAVKTGTSNNFADNWTIGYTTDLVGGVWVGNNDNSPMINVIGVDGAGPIWHNMMLLAEKGYPVRNFVNPGGVVTKTVSYPGLTTTDLYLK
jgi:membrane peptidoglycan carboxypeptidase